jgi:hypothetical protein
MTTTFKASTLIHHRLEETTLAVIQLEEECKILKDQLAEREAVLKAAKDARADVITALFEALRETREGQEPSVIPILLSPNQRKQWAK